MDNELKTKPLNEIILEVSKLKQQIYYDVMRYNELSNEVCRRFPTEEILETFKPLTIEREEVMGNVRSKSR